MKKIFAFILATVMCLSLFGCGGDTTDTNGGTTEPQQGGVEQISDFGGYEFVIADWFYVDGEETNFDTAWAEFVYNYQKSLETDYNFTYDQVNLALTGDYTELVPAKIMAGDKDVSMYYFFEGYVLPSVSQNLLWDLTELDSFDKNDPKWDKISMDTFTFGDGIYAVDPATREPLMGMFYNKRLLEEAGLDPDLPYDLQASGEWTWAKFEELCAAVTQDTDKDGQTDIWAMGSTYGNLALSAVWSNGAAFVKKDANGKFIDGTTEPAFLESMEWLQKLVTNGWLWVKKDKGNSGDTLTAFQNGELAFLPYNFWLAEESTLTECVDDWGWVYLPYGPSASGITMCAQSYGYAIPKTLSKDEAEKVFQIFDKLTDLTVDGAHNDWSVEGADEYEDTFWMDAVGNNVRDARAVDETLYSMMFSTDMVTMDYVRMIPGFNYTNFASDILNLKKTPMEKIEEMRPANQAALNSANGLLGYE